MRLTDKIATAGLPELCVTHGLRKAAARRLAEAGCTTKEIAAITGHTTLQEVERYTKAAEQRRLARTAIRRLPGGTNTDEQSPNCSGGFGKPDEKPINIITASEEWRAGQDESANQYIIEIAL